jgi:hypothetical protein
VHRIADSPYIPPGTFHTSAYSHNFCSLRCVDFHYLQIEVTDDLKLLQAPQLDLIVLHDTSVLGTQYQLSHPVRHQPFSAIDKLSILSSAHPFAFRSHYRSPPISPRSEISSTSSSAFPPIFSPPFQPHNLSTHLHQLKSTATECAYFYLFDCRTQLHLITSIRFQAQTGYKATISL